VADLLGHLREAGAHEQAAALLARDPAAHAALDNPYGLTWLLDSLRQAGAHEQVAALLARDPVGHAALDDPGDVARLLGSLRQAGAHEQVAALLARDPVGHAALDDPGDVARLLGSLQAAGAHEQAAALAARAAAHAPLDDPGQVARLLGSPPQVGVYEQVGLDGLVRMSVSVDRLWQAGVYEQAAALLARDPAAHAALDDPGSVASLLDSLQAAGAHDQAAVLTDRLSAAGMFVLFLKQNDPADQFRFGRQADGTPAAPWGWEDLNLWLAPVRGDTLHRRSAERDVHVGRHAARQPRPRPSTPKPKR